MSPTGWLGSLSNGRFLMAHGIYRTSSKPVVWAGGTEGLASTISPPVRYRAGDNTYTETKGKKLYKKRGGALATRVIKTTFIPEMKVVNVSDNVWREGL
jgi:hypothetical protein